MRRLATRTGSALLALLIVAGYATAQTPAASALRELIQEERRARGGGADGPGFLRIATTEQAAEQAARARNALQRLQAIDTTQLDRNEQLDYDLFRRELENRLAAHAFGVHLMPVNHEGGPHSTFMRLGARGSLSRVAEYEQYLERLRDAPSFFDQQVTLMREGMRAGRTQPRDVLGGHGAMIDGYLAVAPEESPLFAPFVSMPATIPEAEQTRLRKEARDVIAGRVHPALAAFRDFLTKEYIPSARSSHGVLALEGGREYYDHLVRFHTTLDITAEKVHEIGLAEVARIRGEMTEIIRAVGFEGDFAAFLEFLRADPRFYVDTPEALISAASTIAKRVDGLLPSVFHLKTLPRRPYGVEPVPADLAPNYTGGRYSGAQRDDRAGFYWVNTYNLPSRPLYVLPALTLHEAVPGHHLQIALAQEMGTSARGGVTAFSEGWALYAEYLGREMGIYDDPYTDFGRLTYEMWRACRLVVDTGIHAKGWTRQQARDYLAANTALSLHEVQTETDRYIAVPGQALAYKMGELTIRRLRSEAETQLGERFSLRDFHHAVLEHGPVPLSVLEENVRTWMREVAGRTD